MSNEIVMNPCRCGTQPEVRTNRDNGQQAPLKHRAECVGNCDFKPMTRYYETDELAMIAWNIRSKKWLS